MNGNYEQAEEIIKLIWEKAQSAVEKAEAYAQLINQQTMLSRNEEAIQSAAKALTLLGMGFPEEGVQAAQDGNSKRSNKIWGTVLSHHFSIFRR